MSHSKGVLTIASFGMTYVFLLFHFHCIAFVNIQNLGSALAKYAQTGVSFERMAKLLQGAPPQTLVAFNPLYLKGSLPEIQSPKKTQACWLEQLEARNLTYRYPDTGRGIKGVNLCIRRSSLT